MQLCRVRHAVGFVAQHKVESARRGNIPTLPNHVLDGGNVALLAWNVMEFCAECFGQRESHRGFSGSRWTRKEPRGRIRTDRELCENPLRFVQSSEIGNRVWPIFLCERHRKRKRRGAHCSLP